MRHRRVLSHDASCSCGGGGYMLLVATPRVRVVVYSRVPGELVGSTEALGASRERAGVRLLARVRADMASLVFKAVEGLLAQRTLVRAWEVVALVFVGAGLSIL